MPSDVLSSYRTSVSRNNTAIYCEICKEGPLFCRDFKVHLLKKHCDRFADPNSCEWCFGNFNWSLGTKSQQKNHLEVCYRYYWRKHQFKYIVKEVEEQIVSKFIFSVELTSEELSPNSIPFLDDFAECDLFPLDTSKMDWWTNLPTDSNQLSFWNEYDDLGIEYVRKYAANEESVGFIQLMVRRSTFPNFMKYMQEYGSNAFLLPFSCLCSGGIEWHRHMICVTRDMEDFMDNCWRKVRAGPEKDKNYKSKASKVIKDWNHLRNVIAYVSKEEAQCSFFKNTPGRHFYIMHSVTKYFKWLAVFSVKEGITKLLNEMFGHKSLQSYVDNCFRKSRKKYAVLVKHLNPPMNVVLPVAKHWICVQDEVTDAYFYLLDGKKLYFKVDKSLKSLPEDEWIEKQGSSGNCFMKAIAEELWYPLKREQQILNIMRDINFRYDSEMSKLKAEKAKFKLDNSKLSSENAKLKSRNAKLKLRNAKLISENRNLKSDKNTNHFEET